MDIVVGDKVLMEFSTYGDRYLSIVTDIKDDGRIFVYSPISLKVVERMWSDSEAQIKYARNGRLLGFRTRVVNRVTSPGSIIELARPYDMFDAEDRTEVRCCCSFPAVVADGDRIVQAVVEDISASCSRVRFLDGGSVSFSEDEVHHVQLTFHPFDMEGDGYCADCVVRNAFMKDGKRYAVLEFDQKAKDFRRRISRFIEAQVCCGVPRLY